MGKPTGRPPGRPRKNPAPDIAADDDDLIGDSAPPKQPAKRGPGRPPKSTSSRGAAKSMPTDETGDPISLDIGDVYGGVTATWLAHIFGQDRNTIKKKLARGNCQPVGRGLKNAPLYAIHEACAHLVKPKVDLISYIKGLRPNDLPPILNDAYWGAMIKRQKWEENAKDLWRTEDVAKVLGDVAFLYKTTSQLWVEELDRHHGLTPELRETITQLVDNLLERVHDELTALPAKSTTPSSVAEEGAIPTENRKPDTVEGVNVQ